MRHWYRSFAATSSELVGTPQAFTVAVVAIAAWFVAGPFVGWSNTWQLVANTTTTLVTTLLVLLVQHSQNVNTTAMQKKLDELIRAVDDADDAVRGIERRNGGAAERG